MRTLLLVALLLSLPSSVLGEGLEKPDAASAPVAHEAAKPEAVSEAAEKGPEVTPANLFEQERFWPYHVALVEAVGPLGGEKTLRAGQRGVLVRVEPSGFARVDFGRHGLHRVPIAATDLVAQANRLRRGELHKMGPNLSLAIGSRLLSSDSLRPLGFPRAAQAPGFLCVFADPDAEGFAELSRALSPLLGRHGVLTVLFPQGEHSDAEVRDRVLAAGWTPFLAYDFLSETYTASLIDPELGLPAVALQTNEGRLLFQSSWSGGVATELTARLDQAFGAPVAATAGVAAD